MSQFESDWLVNGNLAGVRALTFQFLPPSHEGKSNHPQAVMQALEPPELASRAWMPAAKHFRGVKYPKTASARFTALSSISRSIESKIAGHGEALYRYTYCQLIALLNRVTSMAAGESETDVGEDSLHSLTVRAPLLPKDKKTQDDLLNKANWGASSAAKRKR
jgi:hypothetical protein